MRVSIKLDSQAAGELHRGAPATQRTRAVVQTVRKHGAAIQPMHPGTDDPELRSYFFADVDEDAAAEELARALRDHEAVEGAYTKPPDALP